MKIILLFLCILSVNLISADYIGNYFELIDSGFFPKKGISNSSYLKKIDNKKIIFLENEKKKFNEDEKINIFIYNNKNWKNFSVTLNNSDWIFDFDFKGNKLFILGQFNLYEYKITEKSIKFISSYDIEDYHFLNLSILQNSKILLFSNTIFDNNLQLAIWEKNKITKKYIEKDQLGIAYSLIQPKRNISTFKNKIIVADYINFRVRIFDDKLKKINEISIKPSNWKEDKSKFESISKFNTYEEYQSNPSFLLKYLKHNSIIEFVNLINDSTLVVQYSVGNPNRSEDIIFAKDNYCAIYKYKDKKFNLYKDKIIAFEFGVETIDKNFFKSLYGRHIVEDDFILVPFEYPYLIKKEDLKTFKINRKEFDNKSNDFYKKNDLFGTFYLYKWKGE